MRILVDADACPVINIIEKHAQKNNIECVLICDMNHILHSDISVIKYVDPGKDAADLVLINMCKKGDIVVTQDYGVAALALSKSALAINHNGFEYTNEMIDMMLLERHLANKTRKSHKNYHKKGPSRRNEQDDLKFEECLLSVIAK